MASIVLPQAQIDKMYSVRATSGAVGRALSVSSVTLGPRSTAAFAPLSKHAATCFAKPANDNAHASGNLKVSSITLGMLL